MGRPKGSKNKPRDLEIIPPAPPQAVEWKLAAPMVLAEPKQIFALPDSITICLTDEDLAPVRRAKANHDKAAAKYRRDEIQAELRRKEIGEVEELSVPQVVGFDMSAAFNKVAAQKARAAGYRFVHNLRRTPDGWVFEASNLAKVKNDAPIDQP